MRQCGWTCVCVFTGTAVVVHLGVGKLFLNVVTRQTVMQCNAAGDCEAVAVFHYVNKSYLINESKCF